MAFHPNKLIDDIVKIFRRSKLLCILGIKKITHIETIQPHLVRISEFMPEASLFRSWLPVQLFTEKLSRLFILFFFGSMIERKENSSWCDVIEIVFQNIIGFNTAIGLDIFVHHFFYVVEVCGILCLL